MQIEFYRYDRNSEGEFVKSILSVYTYEIGITKNEAIANAVKLFEEEIKPKKWNQFAHGYLVS